MPPPQYQAGVHPGYMPYQNYARSPPPMQQFAPMTGVAVSPGYHRASPNPTVPYQTPLAYGPNGLPHTPSSTHSSLPLRPPTPMTPQTPRSEQSSGAVPPSVMNYAPPPMVVPIPAPELPWLSHPDVPFPKRVPRSKRQNKFLAAEDGSIMPPVVVVEQKIAEEPAISAKPEASTQAQQQNGKKEAGSASDSADVSKTSEEKKAPVTRPAAPAVPVVPVPPKHSPKPSASAASVAEDQQGINGDAAKADNQDSAAAATAEPQSNETNGTPSPVVRAPPTSWANLFAKPSARAAVNGSAAGADAVNGGSTDGPNNFNASSFSRSNAHSLAQAIQSYQVENIDKVDFLEPRGLINTGNMCYMNSVLQVLVSCVPFYDFLDQVGKKAAHSFKSETPLIDALIMFMREFKVLKSAPSVEQLNRLLKNEDFERYGEPFTPEFVYEAIRHLPRFASMRRGHQQDAEEFLGFLLQSLDDECTHVMRDLPVGHEEVPSSNASTGSGVASDDWLEVGRKQRAAVSRLSGHNTSTPITKIFGGLLRSEFRVPGLKDSITTERYQPLQLDIGSPDINNVVDALRGLTRPERLQGDFNSPRGKDVVATKQVFIESLPPVLILHLKRFQFDAEGRGTVKIWKKIGYPLELEIPREALSRQRRQNLDNASMPRYRLISVVYHHGKNASGGHYTVDVRRQDGREWIRLDDTVIRRIRPEDIAESGVEEDAKDARKDAASNVTSNRFGAMNDDDTGDEDGWKQVTAPTSGGKKWSSVVNGATNGAARDKQVKDSIKDNKVAYILFYQRI
ncbi:cysteine proteinase [Trichoderma citrinoviride]|uniref:Ubiquitin carboxyl-terminal hydrolase n=1 Tax=Trichoderma citrinoviride TaxID=58853 RepID=A0A2T4BGY1_9HYPO|nr:cysteine proteinase [Trichoderma citrinoviride]PTB68575.1 cysteine proteinase [Trichoderma citrinoviride]